jgi:hypothetical protein
LAWVPYSGDLRTEERSSKQMTGRIGQLDNRRAEPGDWQRPVAARNSPLLRLVREEDTACLTTAPVQADHNSCGFPEFARWRTVEHYFGIKRGTLYNISAEGKVKSVCIRRKGNTRGCRLFHMRSISEYLHSLME